MTAVADDAVDSRSRAREARLEDLLRLYGALIRRVVSRTAGREGDGIREDIEQQVIISLWKQVEREQTIDHPTSYIYRAAVRETVRALRRARSREQASGDAFDLAPLLETENNPETDLQNKQRAASLVEVVDSLQPERRLAVRAHLAGHEVAEIMRMFGWPYQKARNLVSRGMADLRTGLIEKGIRG